MYARVIGPKFPNAGLIPTFAWNSASAFWVIAPKYPVAPTFAKARDSEPLFCEIKNACSVLTSLFRLPVLMLRTIARTFWPKLDETELCALPCP